MRIIYDTVRYGMINEYNFRFEELIKIAHDIYYRETINYHPLYRETIDSKYLYNGGISL